MLLQRTFLAGLGGEAQWKLGAWRCDGIVLLERGELWRRDEEESFDFSRSTRRLSWRSSARPTLVIGCPAKRLHLEGEVTLNGTAVEVEKIQSHHRARSNVIIIHFSIVGGHSRTLQRLLRATVASGRRDSPTVLSESGRCASRGRGGIHRGRGRETLCTRRD